MRRMYLLAALLIITSAGYAQQPDNRGPHVVVLGIGQDGGVPQAGTEHPGWENPDRREKVVSLGIVDPETGQRWMIEATPDFRAQLHILNNIEPSRTGAPAGIFLTHAHIGHYTGLMFLGHESMGANEVPVYTMPKMGDFLSGNGPWNQLVQYENIALNPLAADSAVQLTENISVTPFLVPHRQEYSEVVGYKIAGPKQTVLFIPDIDSWEEWEQWGTTIEDEIRKVDIALLDATFYANGEIPGRDMSGFPHPFITKSMKRFNNLSADDKAKVYFIHLNHTNPALIPGSDARKTIRENGFHVAEELITFNL